MSHTSSPGGRAAGPSGASAEYIDQLYEAFRSDPDSVSSAWRNYFYGFEHGAGVAAPVPAGGPRDASAAAERLLMAYRMVGHLVAATDPLAAAPPPPRPELDPGYYGLGPEDLAEPFPVVSIDPGHARPLGEVVAILARVYCGAIGSEHMHIAAAGERRWIEQRLESSHGDWAAQHPPEVRRELLRDLTAAEGLEHYLHRRFVGQKRFSLEGAESLIPLLDELVQGAGQRGVTDVVLGMAHRGRLNVLVNLLGKAPQELFLEFEGGADRDARAGSGDVKYHQGFYSHIRTPGGPVRLSLAFNPSHLEIVGPVVEGGVRARQDRHGDDGRDRVVPVLIHGDAAFIGQGVVTETLNLAQTPAYGTGGTIHVVVNNQIGFTTSRREEARSTLYCTDVAKLVQAPILHVNGDDPDAVLFATRLALDYRLTLHNDVVIDLVCYRRHGHNEADDPTMTQPLMYRRIQALETTRAAYARRLEEAGVVGPGEAAAMGAEYLAALDHGRVVVREFLQGSHTGYEAHWEPYLRARPGERVDTCLSAEALADLGARVLTVPTGFHLNRRVARVYAERRRMVAGETGVDWGMAELLAYGSLLADGHRIRLTGQDSQRGTFAHRHGVLHDQDTGAVHVPLEALCPDRPRFEIINSPLSELAALAFEYGYATSSPDALVIWEAQFGDFGNAAQVLVDQFLSSGYLKWGRLCQLTLFLPHGFEGQGPEHSSARLERYLQLCAELNMRVWVPTTPAQLFHLLRDQIKRRFRRPLVVMMPKSLLRHPEARSRLEAFTGGALAVVQPEQEPLAPEGVRRVVLCSGRVYYDLRAARRERGAMDVALVRVEQLYPFPRDTVTRTLAAYPNAGEVVWCQEEPRNQGAWYQVRHHLQAATRWGQRLGYAGRPPSAAPACGYAWLHGEQQRALVDTALAEAPVDDPGERLEDSETHPAV